SDHLNVKFGSAVDETTFTPEDVHFVGPNGAITITNVKLISVPDANGVNPRNLFEIDFPSQASVGSYTITVGYNPPSNVPEISDPSGFLMNQNNNTVNGEPVVDQYTNTIQLNSATNNHLVVTSFPSTATAGVAVS